MTHADMYVCCRVMALTQTCGCSCWSVVLQTRTASPQPYAAWHSNWLLNNSRSQYSSNSQSCNSSSYQHSSNLQQTRVIQLLGCRGNCRRCRPSCNSCCSGNNSDSLQNMAFWCDIFVVLFVWLGEGGC